VLIASPSRRAARPARPRIRPHCRNRLGAAAASPGQRLDAQPRRRPAPRPPEQPLAAGHPGADPLSLFGFLFTPIFQGLFLLLAGLYALTGNILVAIVLMTLMIRLVTIKLSARQIVSQKRMQILAPELRELTKELQRRYKGDRLAIQKATQEFYKERGVSPTAGCLPSLLQMGLLFPMYWVIRDGLTNFDPSAMLKVFGVDLDPVDPVPQPGPRGQRRRRQGAAVHQHRRVRHQRRAAAGPLQPAAGRLHARRERPGVTAGLLQFIQSRMLMPPAAENDPSASTQRTMMVIFPFFSVIYGGFLPAGLFVYWITTSVFSIVQQFLIVGWGSMFPLFGWNPGLRPNHTPRFPVTMPEPAECRQVAGSHPAQAGGAMGIGGLNGSAQHAPACGPARETTLT
jgi:YidC/Oxa1 family membrane protein insertase